MIPKRIHYCWFSGDPFPETVSLCIASWHKFMPDWEFVLWDYNKIKDIDNVWLQECISVEKWAFAADFIRLYALYHEGGIYLDADVEVFKDFSILLSRKAFIGREWTWHTERFHSEQYLTSHCFGAEAGNQMIGRCLDFYSKRHFEISKDKSLPDSLRYNQMLLPQIQCELMKQEGYQPGLHADKHIISLTSMDVFPSGYFDPQKSSRVSFCRHYGMGGWILTEKQQKHFSFSYRIKYRLDRWLKTMIFWIWHCL